MKYHARMHTISEGEIVARLQISNRRISTSRNPFPYIFFVSDRQYIGYEACKFHFRTRLVFLRKFPIVPYFTYFLFSLSLLGDS